MCHISAVYSYVTCVSLSCFMLVGNIESSDNLGALLLAVGIQTRGQLTLTP